MAEDFQFHLSQIKPSMTILNMQKPNRYDFTKDMFIQKWVHIRLKNNDMEQLLSFMPFPISPVIIWSEHWSYTKINPSLSPYLTVNICRRYVYALSEWVLEFDTQQAQDLDVYENTTRFYEKKVSPGVE